MAIFANKRLGELQVSLLNNTMPRPSAGDLSTSPSSPRRRLLSNMGKRSPAAIQLLKELRHNDLSQSPASSSPLGQASLEGIQNQASLIAEMRPNRRKIKWQKNVSDSGRYKDGNDKQLHQATRMAFGINIQDLDIYRASGTSPRKEISYRSQSPVMSRLPSPSRKVTTEDEIEALERKIQRIHKTIARLENETADLNQQTDKLKEQNKDLLNEIHGTASVSLLNDPNQHHHQQQSERAQRLEERIAESDAEISLLHHQTNAVRTATMQLVEHKSTLPQSAPTTPVELSLSLSSSSEAEEIDPEEEEVEQEEAKSLRSEILARSHYKHRHHSSRSTSSLPSKLPLGRPPLPSLRAAPRADIFNNARDHRLTCGST